MEKNSKVLNVQANGTFEFPKGSGKTFYSFEIEMENGDFGTYNSVSPDGASKKFPTGQNAIYTYDTSNPKFPKIKPVYASGYKM